MWTTLILCITLCFMFLCDNLLKRKQSANDLKCKEGVLTCILSLIDFYTENKNLFDDVARDTITDMIQLYIKMYVGNNKEEEEEEEK